MNDSAALRVAIDIETLAIGVSISIATRSCSGNGSNWIS